MSGIGALLLGVLVAGVVPALIGAVSLAAWRGAELRIRLVLAALAYPVGATLVSLAMILLGIAQIPLTVVSVPMVALLLALLACFAARRWLALEEPRPWPVALLDDLGGSWLRAGLGVGVFANLAFVWFEVSRKPIEIWDAFAVWTLRAKAWSARQSLILDPADPFYLGGGARTDYPPHASLLHAWPAIGLGEWNDIVVNLPWALVYSSAVLLVYAVARLTHGRLWGWVGAFALSGLPLFVVHASHAGYADVILAAHFLLVVSTAFLADRARSLGHSSDRVWRALSVGFVLSLPLIKLEGVPLMVAAAVGLVLQSGDGGKSGRRKRWPLLLAAVLVAVMVAAANQALRDYVASTQLHVEAVGPVLSDLFLRGNWNLLWLLFWGLAVAQISGVGAAPTRRLSVMIMIPFVPFLYVLWCTDAWQFAVNRTADSRLFLALAPAAVLYVSVAAAELWAAQAAVPTPVRRGKGKKPG